MKKSKGWSRFVTHAEKSARVTRASARCKKYISKFLNKITPKQIQFL